MPIRVYYSSAFLAPEQGIVSTAMSLTNSTAMVAELGRMPCINDVQRNILVKIPLHEVLPESKEGNPHDFTIESLSFRTESFEVFNGNVCIVSRSHFGDVPHDFAYSVLDKVISISFSPLKRLIHIGASGIGITLEDILPFKIP
jgi:hypothetical protein